MSSTAETPDRSRQDDPSRRLEDRDPVLHRGDPAAHPDAQPVARADADGPVVEPFGRGDAGIPLLRVREIGDVGEGLVDRQGRLDPFMRWSWVSPGKSRDWWSGGPRRGKVPRRVPRGAGDRAARQARRWDPVERARAAIETGEPLGASVARHPGASQTSVSVPSAGIRRSGSISRAKPGRASASPGVRPNRDASNRSGDRRPEPSSPFADRAATWARFDLA